MMADQLVNLRDPDTGEIGSLAASQVPAALNQGFAQVSPEELAQHFKEEKYGTTSQQVATGLEGAASALSFGLSTGAERALGVPGEDIRARREVNPVAHGVGELGGIGVGALYGAGEAAALEHAGLEGAAAIGLGAEKAGHEAYALAKAAGLTKDAAAAAKTAALAKFGTVSKIGSQAAKLAIENALFTGGDEVSKMFSGDPNQSMGTAMADVGLSGLIGGATGAGLGVVSPLWKATAGRGVESLLNAVKNKAGGVEGITSPNVNSALEKTGVDASPDVRARLSDDPRLQGASKILEQSDTTASGAEHQANLTKTRSDLNNVMLESVGHSPDSVAGVGELSKYEAGKKIGNSLADEIHAQVDPLAKEFEELKGKVGNVELQPDGIIETPKTVMDPQDLTGVPRVEIEKTRVPGVMSQVGEKVAELASKEGWLAAEDTPIGNLVEFVQKNLGKQKTLKDLGNFISRVGEKAESLASLTDRSATRAGAMIKGILKDAEAGVIETKLGEHGPELVQRFKNVRDAWRKVSDLVDEVQEQIGVKASTSGYAKAVREMAQQDGEALLRRIAGSGNAAGLQLLAEKFPKAAEEFRQFHLDSLIKDASSKAKPGEIINPKALIRGIDKLSPEMRGFIVPEAAAQKINAVGTLLEQLEKAPHNHSNTARTLDKLNQYIPGGAVAMAGALSGHGVAGLVLGPLMKALTKDAPDAVRLSMLKYIGSNQQVDSAAFKAMTDVARAVYRGEAAVTRATRGVLRSGSKVVSEKDVSQNDRDKLDKQLLALKQDPTPLMNVGGDMGHYLPDHSTVTATMAAQAVNYLNSLRPDTDKKMPFDAKIPADPVKKAAFNRALDIAENPLIVLNSVKEGSVTPSDLTTLQNVSPGLYARMREKLNNEIINFTAEENDIPYKTRLGLALFLGQPLDSTMTPMGIQAAQPKMPAQPQMAQGMKPTATGMQKLSKLGPGAATQGQQREMGRASHLA